MPGVLSTASNFVCKGFGLDSAQNETNKGGSEPAQIPDRQIGSSPTESFLSRMRNRIVSCLSWLREMFFPGHRRDANNSVSLARVLILGHWIPAVFRSIYRRISNTLTSIICRRTRQNSSPAQTVPAVKCTSEEPQDKSDAGTETTEGDQRVDGPALVQTAHGGPEPKSLDKLDPSETGTETTEGDQKLDRPALAQTAHGGPEPEPQDKSDPLDAGTQTTEGDQRLDGPAVVTAADGGPEPKTQDKLDSSLSDSPSEKPTLVLGCSIIQDVVLETPATEVKCIPEARVGSIEFYLKLMRRPIGNFKTIIVHVGTVDARFYKPDYIQKKVASLCKYAKTMSDFVVFSGPIPDLSSDEIFSRMSSYNLWLSSWCPENDVAFIDNWSDFYGKPDLLQSDGVQPTLAGAALLSRNLANFVEGQQRFDGPAVIGKVNDEQKPEPQEKLDPSVTGTQTTEGEQRVDGPALVQTAHGGPEPESLDKLDTLDAGTEATEGDQRVDGPALVQTVHGGPEPESLGKLDPLDAGTQTTEGEQIFNGQTVVQTIHGGPEPQDKLDPLDAGTQTTEGDQRLDGPAVVMAADGGPEPKTQDKVDSSLSDSPSEKPTLVLGCSIIQDVVLETPATEVKCIPEARVGSIEFYLKLMRRPIGNFKTIIVHVGTVDARFYKPDYIHKKVASLCKYAKTMSDFVVFSGPIPDLSSDEIFSRMSSYNLWLSSWCPENDVAFIDNWSDFYGKPDLLQSDGVQPTLTGAALLSRNLANFVEGQQRFDGPAVIGKANDEQKPEPQEKLDPSETGTQTTKGD